VKPKTFMLIAGEASGILGLDIYTGGFPPKNAKTAFSGVKGGYF